MSNPSFTPDKRSIGNFYEEMAEKFLLEKGLMVLKKNYSCRLGEIDLVMLENSELVFVEVRYRNVTQYGTSIETVTRSKQNKIMRTAQYFLNANREYQYSSCRFDVLGIDKDLQGKYKFSWIKNAFME